MLGFLVLSILVLSFLVIIFSSPKGPLIDFIEVRARNISTKALYPNFRRSRLVYNNFDRAIVPD